MISVNSTHLKNFPLVSYLQMFLFEEQYLSLEVQSSSSRLFPNHHWTIDSFLNCKTQNKKNLNHFLELWIAMNNIPAEGSGPKENKQSKSHQDQEKKSNASRIGSNSKF